MLKVLIPAGIDLIKTFGSNIGFVKRYLAMKDGTFWHTPWAEGEKRTYTKWGIVFKYVLIQSTFVTMEKPLHSFTCPKCGMHMVYRGLKKYRCENHDCRHKAKVTILGEGNLYHYIIREIKVSLGL